MRRFENQVVVVTGGGGGIGAEICRRFALEGARVVVVDVSNEVAARGVAAVTDSGLQADSVALDVADEQAVDGAFDDIETRYGRLDVLVCAAGIRPLSALLDHPLHVWDTTIRVNLTGVFVCGKAAARHMTNVRRGVIINIASVNGLRAVVGQTAYSASKSGVISVTQSMASELAPFGVRVNAVLPAQIETPMIAEQKGEERRRREERIPLGRYGTPREVAGAVCFLASDDASFITGHGLAVDGGYLAFGFRPSA
jgi:3-oxoacyl-[acyl-carrier protein] reductase